jgi:hypothetical protein
MDPEESGSIPMLSERTAIFYAEYPAALARDFPDERLHQRIWERVDRLVKQAEASNSLAWQAYSARRANRPTAVNTADAAELITSSLAAGAKRREVPPTPR